jgi:beta-mannanase
MGAVPLVQLLPRGYGVAGIASGRYDRYLTAYARAVAAFHDPVILSFAHEMNAIWWPWGYGYDTPGTFIAAWRHIWRVFRQAGARNVIWMWNINRDALPGQQLLISPPRVWWPGARYVSMVGIDGYFNGPADTFSSVFGPTLRSVARFTGKPVLIAETATAPGPDQAAQIRSLFAGVRDHGLAGFVWFDINSREHWHIEGRPAADAAFRAAAVTYRAVSRNRKGITNGP